MKDIETIKTNFSKRLRELVKELAYVKGQNEKLTIAELARLSKVPRTTINSWKLGKKCPTLYSAYLIAEYFNVSLDYLIGRKEVE